MICQKCGAEIPDDKFYCEICGTAVQMVPDYDPVVEGSIGEEEKTSTEEDAFPSKEPEAGKRLLLRRYRLLIIVFCLVLLGITGYQAAYRFAALSEKEEMEEPEEVIFLAAPKFSVEPGTYSYEQSLTISHSEGVDGKIYYTTDGTSPGTESMVYTSPILIGEGKTTVRAIFVRSDGVMSEEAEVTYEVVFEYPEEPEFSMESGNYTEGFTVTLTAEPGCRIYYTMNGEEPNIKSTLYTGPITIYPGLTVLQAVAVDDGGSMSGIVEKIYKVAESAPGTEAQPEGEATPEGEVAPEIPAG